MGLWSFLRWLWNRRWRVIYLISVIFWSIVDVARHARGWIENAYRRAVDAARHLYHLAIQYAYSLYLSARRYVEEFVVAKLREFLGWLQQWIERIRNTLIEYLSAVVERLRQYLLGVIFSVRDYLITIVNVIKGMLEQVRVAFEVLRRIVNSIRALVGLWSQYLSLTTLQRLRAFFQPLWSRFWMFFTSPLAFIMAFWRAYLLQFLSFAIAYALGTVKYDLPPWPDFISNPPPPDDFDVPPPPPGNVLQHPPLAKLWISGYTFGPGHPGVDFGCPNGTPVFACHNGKVITAGWSNAGYGLYIVIKGGDWWTLYAHLQELRVVQGQNVVAGQVIALSNNTGNSTGPHLHFEVKYKGRYVDPMTVLP